MKISLSSQITPWLKLALVIIGSALASLESSLAASSGPVLSSHRQYYERNAGWRAWFDKNCTPGGVSTIVGPGISSPYSYRIGVFSDTNVVTYKPLPSQAFDARLFDPDGKQVIKTHEGHKFGKPLAVDAELLDPIHHRILNVLRDERIVNNQFPDWEFDLLKSFRIKKPGPYRLEVQVRLFFKDTNGVFQPLLLPAVEIPAKIPETIVPSIWPWQIIAQITLAFCMCVSALVWLMVKLKTMRRLTTRHRIGVK
jgi:hypothetical protein